MNIKQSLLTTSIAVALVGCMKKSPDEAIQAAQDFIAQKDYNSAIIEFKNAIKEEPTNAQTRLMLAKLYLELGYLEEAEKELNVALQNGAKEQNIFPDLARVLYLQNDYQQISEIDIDFDMDVNEFSEQQLVQLNTFRGIALDKLNDTQGMNLLKDIVESDIESPYVEISRAYTAFKDESAQQSKDFNDAIGILDTAISEQPEFSDAVLFRGFYNSVAGNYASALEDFKKYQQLMPNANFIRFHLAHTYMKLQQNEKAITEADYILKRAKGHPFALEVKAVSNFRLEQYEQAQLNMEQAIQGGSDNDTNRTIAGLSAYQLAKYNQALNHLEKLSTQLPITHPGKRALLLTEIKLGQSDEISATLNELAKDAQPEVLSQVTMELIKSGNEEAANEAVELLEKSIARASQDSISADLKRQLGTYKLSLADLDGLTDLEASLSLAPESTKSKANLAAAYLQAKQFDKAIALGKSWIAEEPENAGAYGLVGVALAAKGDVDSAEQYLNTAYELDNNNIAAQMYFATKAANDKDNARAISFVKSVLALQPRYFPALKLYFNVAANSDDYSVNEVAEHIESHLEGTENQAVIRFLAKVYSYNNDYEKALSTLNKSTNYSTEYWQMKTRLLVLTQNVKQALEVANNWIKVEPNTSASWANKLQITESLGLHTETLKTTEEALKRFPNNSMFLLFKAYHLINSGKIANAELTMDKVDDKIKASGMGQRVIGQIIAMKENYVEALPILKHSYELWPSNGTAAIIYITHTKNNEEAKGLAFLEEHLAKKPKDPNASFVLANSYIYSHPEKAIKYYRHLLSIDKNNLVAMNNLAFLYSEKQDYDTALTFALQAANNSKNTQVMDTLADIYIKMNNKADALEWIDRGLELDNNNSKLLEKKAIAERM